MFLVLILFEFLFLKSTAEQHNAVDLHSKGKITVALETYMQKDQNTVKGLDISILKNFGIKYNLQVDFVIVNKSIPK